ncbi:twitching motility protein PilT [Asticcacaulis sp. AC460]|uniref:type II toxin-antitoxin system VapC family toxin n=1 Tax=Asticcacaulis sp. AC460 TaxID=1282360 RepID=UPI0003C3E887|nr:type II toxin-antitoxin system VapC family toxin [Asticcacaulis sp. AC460]ESQ90325.1 twitching motility protein PilT [Asticcacaulis sp. AC460]
MALLLDTHVWAWSLTGIGLSATMMDALDATDAIYVSPISFFEIGQKVRIGKWPEMAPYAGSLPGLLEDQKGLVATLTPDIALKAAMMDWEHRDPFDRILAATCLANNWPLVSVDAAFDAVPGLIRLD